MKYVIIATENQRKKWWESDCLPKALKTKSFDSFEEAKKCFRETIASEMAKSKNVKIKDGWYTELKKFVKDSDITPDENEDDVYITWRDVVTMNNILTKVVTDPNYFYPKKRLSVKSVMNDEFLWAFVANKDIFAVSLNQSEITFGTNAHIMDDENKEYFFKYEINNYDGDLLETQTWRLIAID